MTWEPSEIKGWAIVGYGFDEIEELLTVIAHPLESIMLTSRRLEKGSAMDFRIRKVGLLYM